MDRRAFLQVSSAAAALTFPWGWTAAQTGKPKKILMYTRSQTFQHDVVNRNKVDGGKFLGEKGKLAHAEYITTELGKKHGFEVTCTKDGRVFIPEEIKKYDAFFFYTTGDLTAELKNNHDDSVPMPPEGKKALLDAIHSGKGFIGSHCAADTFHSKGNQQVNQPFADRDPYIQMIGGEFITHGSQFIGKMKPTDNCLPGLKGLESFDMMEEWYSLKNFSDDIHVLLVQDTSEISKMNPKFKVEGNNLFHTRPSHPATWVRKHGKGNVFYTSMGHREDVWISKPFEKVLLAGIAWALGNVEANISPNMKEVTPHADVLKGK